MNYFAHAIRYLDRPQFLAGLATPDWLSVADRGVRVRARTIAPLCEEWSGDDREVAEGILQHLEDDRWFHGTRGFYEVNGELGQLLREALGPDESWQCGFLAHILTEMLLDSVLIETWPDHLHAYYAAMETVDAEAVEGVVNRVANRPTTRLAPLIPMFISERFLSDYGDSNRLLWRLNQVMRRVKQPQLPLTIASTLDRARDVVRERQRDLLPAEHFEWGSW